MRTINIKTDSLYHYSLFENNSKIGRFNYKNQRLSLAVYESETNNYHITKGKSFFKEGKAFFSHELKIVPDQKNIFDIKIQSNYNFTITDFRNEKEYTFHTANLFNKDHSLCYDGKKIITLRRTFNWKKFRTERTISCNIDCEDILFFILLFCETYYDI